jgi:acyl carrier protein
MTVSELRRYAKECLASNCIPQQFIELDELPLNSDGEIKRLELQDPFAPKDTYVEPESKTQKALADIWQELLGIGRVGLSDNFFDIGGHSLLAIRLVIKIDKRFGVRLDQSLMIMNTLEQIAMEIDNQSPDDKDGHVAAMDASVSDSGDASNAANDTPEVMFNITKPKKSLFKSLFLKGESK